MKTYIALLRGINVGGKNKVPMADLKQCLEELGFSRVMTYIASGNVIFDSELEAGEIKTIVERVLPEHFNLDSDVVKALVLTSEQLRRVVENKPEGFGDEPETYHSDAIFLIDIDTDEAMKVFNPKEGVDRIWPGDGVIYSQRVSALRTKSRLNRIMGTPAYDSMTIRNWNTTTKLLAMVNERDAA